MENRGGGGGQGERSARHRDGPVEPCGAGGDRYHAARRRRPPRRDRQGRGPGSARRQPAVAAGETGMGITPRAAVIAALGGCLLLAGAADGTPPAPAAWAPPDPD